MRWICLTLLSLLPAFAAAEDCKTVKACKKLCKKKDGRACTFLGIYYYTGEGGTRVNEKRARKAYAQGCDLENQTACANLGWMVLDGEGGKRDYSEAWGIFMDACEAGEVDACGGAGLMMADGLVEQRDLAKARVYLAQACSADNLRACGRLAQMLYAGEGGPKDLRLARQQSERACDKGDQPSCAIFASLLDAGVGGEPEPERAAKLFTAACKAYSGRACAALGEKALAAKKKREAFKLLSQACDLGEIPACRKAASNTHQDKKAAKLLQAACDGADGEACALLGGYYLEGKGVRRNEVYGRLLYGLGCVAGASLSCQESMDLTARPGLGMVYNDASLRSGRLSQQCRRGKAKACLELADMFLTGTGVRADAEKAADLYQQACRRDRPGCARAQWVDRVR